MMGIKRTERGFLLISVILAIAIILLVITMRHKDEKTGEMKNSLEQNQDAVESANQVKILLEQRNKEQSEME